MTLDDIFQSNKKKALKSFEEAKLNKNIDEGIIPILDILNKNPNYYTSSSCYGRIVLLEIPDIGDKKNAIWLGKWHKTISYDDIISSLDISRKGQLWILAQSPIIHIGAKDLDAADRILKIGISCGFKNSGIKSISKNIIVEICSTERLDAPVGRDGKFFCNKDYLNLLIDIANRIFIKSNDKLSKFKTALLNKNTFL